MQNAHQRLGRLENLRNTERTHTQIFLHVDRYIGDEKQAHLFSLFGGDAEVGAIRAAIFEKHTFTLTFPDGAIRTVGFGPDAVCYNGSLALEGRKRTLRHLVAVSADSSSQRQRGNDLSYASRWGDEGADVGHSGQSAWGSRRSTLG
jgi:hypothetical protein